MAKTTHLGLNLTEDENTTFEDWRKSIDGNEQTEKSNMQLIDDAMGERVKFTDYATASKAGVVKIGSGLQHAGNGSVIVDRATPNDIEGKTEAYKPIVPTQLDYAVKVGITTNTETLTDEEKANACGWLGAVEEWDYLVGGFLGTLRMVRWDGAKYIGVCPRNAFIDESIPTYGNNGRLFVGEPIEDTYSPTGREYAANRGWVEDLIAPLVARIEALENR